MAIVSVNEMLNVRTGRIDAQWKRSYRRAWRVITDSPLTGPLEVRLSLPVAFGYPYRTFDPVSGAQLEYDTSSMVTNIDVQTDGSSNDDCQWIATVDYTPWDPTTFPENPLNQPVKITWGGSRFQRTAEYTVPDAMGNVQAILNSAGDYFDPPIQIDDSRPTLQIVRNEAVYNPQLALNWKDTINQYAFFGFPPQTVKLMLPTGDLNYNPFCGFYYVITYEFEINPDTWVKRILDQGMKTWDGTSAFPLPAVDLDGNDVTTPVGLDGNGRQLPIGALPVFLPFNVYNQADFSLLGLTLIGAPGQGM